MTKETAQSKPFTVYWELIIARKPELSCVRLMQRRGDAECPIQDHMFKVSGDARKYFVEQTRACVDVEQHHEVESSAISDIYYDPKSLELTVNFRQGHTYTYQDVPQGVVTEFLAAPSQGKFFNNVIKQLYG